MDISSFINRKYMAAYQDFGFTPPQYYIKCSRCNTKGFSYQGLANYISRKPENDEKLVVKFFNSNKICDACLIDLEIKHVMLEFY